MAENEEELKKLLMKVKGESKKADLKLNILLSMVVQQRVEILEFLQEKMSTSLSTL